MTYPTVGQIRGWGIGLLGLSRQDFYDLRPGEYWEALAAYRDEVEANRRHIGELVRGHAVRVINLFVKKGSQFKDVTKFWGMPWDEQADNAADVVKELNSLTEEERNAKAQEFLRSIGKDNG